MVAVFLAGGAVIAELSVKHIPSTADEVGAVAPGPITVASAGRAASVPMGPMGAMSAMKTEPRQGVGARPAATVSRHGVTMSSMPGMAVAMAMGDGSDPGAHYAQKRMADSGAMAPGSMAGMTMSGPADVKAGGMGSMAMGATGHEWHGGMKMGGMAGMGMGGEDFLSASYPVQGQTVSGEPAALRLVFTRPVQLRSLQLFASSGVRVPLDIPGGTAAASFSTPLPRLPPDTYQARWRIASPDGGADNGAIDFKVG